MVLGALPFGIHRAPLRDLCNFTEHTGTKLLINHYCFTIKFLLNFTSTYPLWQNHCKKVHLALKRSEN